MRFGIFYELQLPRPWHERSEYDLIQHALDQIELADALGYDYAWEVEHHFLEEYSHSSAPEVFLAAASQRTKNIRLGHGIIQLTTNHPARVAERVATLDLVSGGRVELGVGEGSTPTEIHPFGRRVRDKRWIWEEAVQALIPMFSEERVEFRGNFFDMPRRNVIPKPLQLPSPPLWVACSNLDTIASAGQWGMGALGFQFVSPEAAHAWVHRYYFNFLHHQQRLAAYLPNPNIGMVCGFMCAETDEAAREKASGWTYFIFLLQYYAKNGQMENPGDVDLWALYEEWQKTPKAQEALNSGLIGSPKTIRDTLRRYEASGIDQVILLNQSGRTRHEDICESLALFAREVMPEFHDREPEHHAWKADILAGRIPVEQDLDTGPNLYLGHPTDRTYVTPSERPDPDERRVVSLS